MGEYQFVRDAAAARTLDELTRLVGADLAALGLPRFALGLIPRTMVRRSTILIENLGPAWWRAANDPGHASRRRFVAFVRSTTEPFAVPQSFHDSVNARLAAAGLYLTVERSFVVPLRTPEGTAYVLTSGRAFDMVPPEVLQRVRSVAATALHHWHRIVGTGSEGGLTGRERQVLGRVAEGESSPEVACALGITERTVVAHICSAMRKLDARTRTAAVVKAIRRGLIEP